MNLKPVGASRRHELPAWSPHPRPHAPLQERSPETVVHDAFEKLKPGAAEISAGLLCRIAARAWVDKDVLELDAGEVEYLRTLDKTALAALRAHAEARGGSFRQVICKGATRDIELLTQLRALGVARVGPRDLIATLTAMVGDTISSCVDARKAGANVRNMLEEEASVVVAVLASNADALTRSLVLEDGGLANAVVDALDALPQADQHWALPLACRIRELWSQCAHVLEFGSCDHRAREAPEEQTGGPEVPEPMADLRRSIEKRCGRKPASPLSSREQHLYRRMRHKVRDIVSNDSVPPQECVQLAGDAGKALDCNVWVATAIALGVLESHALTPLEKFDLLNRTRADLVGDLLRKLEDRARDWAPFSRSPDSLLAKSLVESIRNAWVPTALDTPAASALRHTMYALCRTTPRKQLSKAEAHAYMQLRQQIMEAFPEMGDPDLLSIFLGDAPNLALAHENPWAAAAIALGILQSRKVSFDDKFVLLSLIGADFMDRLQVKLQRHTDQAQAQALLAEILLPWELTAHFRRLASARQVFCNGSEVTVIGPLQDGARMLCATDKPVNALKDFACPASGKGEYTYEIPTLLLEVPA
jgi:hypothetical protein